MKCEKIEHWISDDLDGALTPKIRQKLESHLSACPACREYQRKVREIQAESIRLEEPAVSTEHLEALSAGVVSRLRPERQGKSAELALPMLWRWARLAAPAILALILGVFLFRSRGEVPQEDIISIEGCFDRAALETAGDAELAAVFNNFLIESLAEEEEALFASEYLELWNEPYFWEALSDDELSMIEEEVHKGIPT
jgi:hypothetical protein